jgi:hypothetical protein
MSRLHLAGMSRLHLAMVFAAFLAWQPQGRATSPVSSLAMDVHVVDYANASADELTRASVEASRLWNGIDVALSWTRDANHTPAQHIVQAGPHPLDVTVLLLRQDMAQRMITQEHRGPGVLARAVPEASRVYVFYDRVKAESAQFGDAPGVILGRVLAHELGHLLLGHSHSNTGLMRAEPELGSAHLAFAKDDAVKIRAGILAKISGH